MICSICRLGLENKVLLSAAWGLSALAAINFFKMKRKKTILAKHMAQQANHTTYSFIVPAMCCSACCMP